MQEKKTFSLVIWSVLGRILLWLNAGVEGLGFSAILALPRFIDSPRNRPTTVLPKYHAKGSTQPTTAETTLNFCRLVK
jgi:hypothetical protein